MQWRTSFTELQSKNQKSNIFFTSTKVVQKVT